MELVVLEKIMVRDHIVLPHPWWLEVAVQLPIVLALFFLVFLLMSEDTVPHLAKRVMLNTSGVKVSSNINIGVLEVVDRRAF